MKNKELSQYDIMTESPLSILIIKLSIPTIISMLITNIYNLADTAFVGTLGNSASGAIGIVFGFMSIIQAIGFMFGQGSGSIIARLLGGKDVEYASKTASTAFFGTIIFGIIISIVGLFSLDWLVEVLGSTKTIKPYAKIYVSCILATVPLMTANFTMNNILRYEGKALLGMIGLLTGGILNICGDAVFMFVFKMGIFGAGLSTAISQCISFLILLSMFLSGKTQSKLSVKNVEFKTYMLLDIITTGLPSLLRQGLNSLTAVLLNLQCAPYGDEAIAAMSIVGRIIFFVFSIAIGTGQGFQPVCGFNYGAKKYSRVRKGFFFTIIVSEVFIATATIVLLAFPSELVAIFRDDPTVCKIGTRALVLQGLALITLPVCMVTEMLYQSTGKKVGASVLSLLRNGLFFIPILLILAKIRGLHGIQEAQPIAFVLSAIPSLIFMRWFLKNMPKNDVERKY